jgi:hypothetical protein
MYVGPLFKTGDRRSVNACGVFYHRGFIVAFDKQYAKVEKALCHLYLKANCRIWLMASHYDVSLMSSSLCCRCTSAGHLARLRGRREKQQHESSDAFAVREALKARRKRIFATVEQH